VATNAESFAAAIFFPRPASHQSPPCDTILVRVSEMTLH